MGMNRLCNYGDIDKFRRVNREGSRESEGVEAGVSEKRPTEERGGSTGERKSGMGASTGSTSERFQRGDMWEMGWWVETEGDE